MGFNFGQIGNVVSDIMDTDYIDIKRDVSGSLVEVYSNVSCHISFSSVDNPDPLTIDIKPVIQTLIIHIPLYVDIQNNDFIVAKKIDSDGAIVAVYSGRCGNPVVSMARKKVSVLMNSTEPDVPTPVPPKNSVTFTYEYIYNDDIIKDSSSENVETNTDFEIHIPYIDGYRGIGIVVDDVMHDVDTFTIFNVDKDYHIKFIYDISSDINYFRFLVNGLFTKDDGSLSNGWHQYKKIPVNSVVINNDEYTVVCDYINIEHEDNGKRLFIDVGTLIVLGSIFVKVESVINNDGVITFVAKEFTPTEEQLNSYICGWYG